MRMKVGVNTADGCVWEFMHCNEDLHYKKLENFSKIWLFLFIKHPQIFPMAQWYFKHSRSLSTVFNDTLQQYNILAFSSLALKC